MCRPDYLAQIEQRITTAPYGQVFIPSDFLDIADMVAVRKALSRLTENGKIRRIIRGLYDRPRFSQFLQESEAPSMEQIAKAIARNFGWKIAPCGDTALNLLRLSTQVPAVWQYVSDGPYREYSIGNLKLEFKHTSNKDIAGQSERTALVTQALKAIGKTNVDTSVCDKLAAVLTKEELAAAQSETRRGTQWIYEVVKSIDHKEK